MKKLLYLFALIAAFGVSTIETESAEWYYCSEWVCITCDESVEPEPIVIGGDGSGAGGSPPCMKERTCYYTTGETVEREPC